MQYVKPLRLLKNLEPASKKPVSPLLVVNKLPDSATLIPLAVANRWRETPYQLSLGTHQYTMTLAIPVYKQYQQKTQSQIDIQAVAKADTIPPITLFQ